MRSVLCFIEKYLAIVYAGLIKSERLTILHVIADDSSLYTFLRKEVIQ